MKFIVVILTVMLQLVPRGQAFIEPRQQRDSILIADQLEYGFTLDSVELGTQFGFQDFSALDGDTLALVRSWAIDTLSQTKTHFNMKASILIAPFEEGNYHLPDIAVARLRKGVLDTLLFEARSFEAKTMPVDTATFEVYPLKDQMKYPVTFDEVWPWCVGVLAFAGLVFLVVWLIIRRGSKETEAKTKESSYIVALRGLDKFRGEKHWAPEKQKAYYSGITDVLKNYIDDRYSIDAPEMTSAELFDALKSESSLTPELYNEMKELFETADFVKFAKMTTSQEEASKALPLAVKFVMNTYQLELEEEQKEDVL